MADLVDRLERVVHRELLRRLPDDPSGDLAKASFADLLAIYGNWRRRLISAQPRTVHVAEALRRSSTWDRHAQALDEITAAITNGADLSPRLSKNIRTAYAPGAGEQRVAPRRADLDLLVSDWGVHHLHLGTNTDRRDPTFTARTPDLLFAIFEPADAYLIGLYQHGDWALMDIVATAVRQWPSANLFLRSETAVGLERQFSDEDRLELREVGVATMLEIDGSVYMPPSQTGAGTPMAVGRGVMRLRAQLDQWRTDTVSRLRNVDGVRLDAYWTPAVHEEMCGFMAEETFLPIGYLVPQGRFG